MVRKTFPGSAWAKNVIREIGKSLSRFVSVVAIIALGVGFFVGVKSTGPDMKKTADLYFSNQNLADMRLLSTIGFDNEDIDSIKGESVVAAVMPSYSADVLMDTAESLYVLKVYSLPEGGSDNETMNRPVLVEGRMPENDRECLMETNGVQRSVTFVLGDTIRLEPKAGDRQLSDILKSDSFTIVGFIDSPLYLSIERGNSTVGDGSVSCYMFVQSGAFSLPVYTDLFLKVSGANEHSAYSGEFEGLIEDTSERLSQLAAVREDAEYNSIITDAQAQIDQSKSDLDREKKDSELKFLQAQKDIESGKQSLAAAQKKRDAEVAAAESKIAESETRIAQSEQQLTAQKQEADRQFAEADAKLAAVKSEYNATKADYDSKVAQVEDGKAQLEQSKQDMADLKLAIDTLKAHIAEDELTMPPDDPHLVQERQALQYLEDQYAVGQEDIAAAEQELAAAEAQLAQAKVQLDASKAQLDEQERQLNAAKADADRQQREAQAQIDEAKTQLAAAKRETAAGKKSADEQIEQSRKRIAAAEAVYGETKPQAEQKLTEGEQKILEAEQKLRELERPKWYIETREDQPGYTGYRENANRIDAVASVFPVFFLAVATLVCLTTMSRMTEEQRGEIGTLKAMGYHRIWIISKYLIYAAAGGIAGSIIGTAIGYRLFPQLIVGAYDEMYNLPPLTALFYPDLFVLATAAALLCTVLVAAASGHRALESPTAVLMRPRAPKSGKRVALEKVRFVWDRLSFLSKVTARNLFRYKGRFLMTVVGIAGCQALLLAGLGLRDSISDIISLQFSQIDRYDMAAALREEAVFEGLTPLGQHLTDPLSVTASLYARQKSLDARNGDRKTEIRLFVPQDTDEFSRMITLRHRTDGKPVSLGNEGAVLSEKTAELLNVKAGETIELFDGNDWVRIPIADITENYVYHYIYMTPKLYWMSFAQEPAYNSVVATLHETGQEYEKNLAEELISEGTYTGVLFTGNLSENLTDTMNSLNLVVLVMVLSAGCLAFVVLYHLTNINIRERIREIATIKVLGFYDREVSDYVFRENMILTLAGILIGTMAGIPLHGFIITQAEVDMVMFGRNIGLWSFVLSALLTGLFSVLVNAVMYFKLKGISMVDSLKSVE